MAEHDHTPSRIENLPMQTRKQIFFVSMVVIALALIGAWASIFMTNVRRISAENQTEPALTDSVGEAINEFSGELNVAQENFAEVSKLLETLSTTTPTTTATTTMSDQQLQALKEKILNRSTSTATTTP